MKLPGEAMESVRAPSRRGRRSGSAAETPGARLLAAVAGGYAVANLGAVALGAALPIARVDAVYAGFLLSFPVHCAAVVWAFAAKTVRRAWFGLAGFAASCLALIGAAHLAGGG